MISASPRRLNVFKTVVERSGFNAAANHLGIAQPSVVAHVKALEAQVGHLLFHRKRGSRPRLTKAGETLYAFAIDVLQRADEAAHKLADLREAEGRQVVMAVHRDIAANILPPQLASFTVKHQHVRLVTRIGTIEDVIETVQRRDAHLGMFLSDGPIQGLHSKMLAREPLVAVAAPSHPLARMRSIAPAELEGCSLVTGLQRSRYAKLVELALQKAGVTRYSIIMELQESPAVKEMVRQGIGIACLPYCTVQGEIGAGELVALPLAQPLQDLELHCAYDPQLPHMARQLVVHLSRTAKTRAAHE